jgi:hypothetical protein
MTRIWLAGCAAASFALALAAPASAADYKTLDTNADNSVSQEEWNAGIDQSGAFKRWDANADAALDQSEFTTGTSTTFKTDMSAGKFDQTRFGDHAAWDANKDGKIDQSEFNTGMYKFYDTDTGSAGLTSDEIGTMNPVLGPAS